MKFVVLEWKQLNGGRQTSVEIKVLKQEGKLSLCELTGLSEERWVVTENILDSDKLIEQRGSLIRARDVLIQERRPRAEYDSLEAAVVRIESIPGMEQLIRAARYAPTLVVRLPAQTKPIDRALKSSPDSGSHCMRCGNLK